MTARIPTANANAAASAYADSALDRADAGAGPGLLRIYTGAQPASADDPVTGTLLAEVALADPAFSAAVNGAKALTDPGGVTGVADGTAGSFRIVDSNDATVLDGSVTSTGGGGDLELDNTSIATGQTVDITGGTITAG